MFGSFKNTHYLCTIKIKGTTTIKNKTMNSIDKNIFNSYATVETALLNEHVFTYG